MDYLICHIMEINNPRTEEDEGIYRMRVGYILTELVDLMKQIEDNPPTSWFGSPYLEVKLVTFIPCERYNWTRFQTFLMIFLRRLYDARGMEFMVEMIDAYPSSTTLIGRKKKWKIERNSENMEYDPDFSKAVKTCLNVLHDNQDSVHEWWAHESYIRDCK